ncbi:MAG: transketolase C-terminal domain-containing protein, partial [Bacteroidota bacterium]
WEKEFDCIAQFKKWIVEEGFASQDQIDDLEKKAKLKAKEAKNASWKSYTQEIKDSLQELKLLLTKLYIASEENAELKNLIDQLEGELNPEKSLIVKSAKRALRVTRGQHREERLHLLNWLRNQENVFAEQYSSHLYSTSKAAAINIKTVPAEYSDKSKLVDGRELLNNLFDQWFEKDERLIAFGEDVGKIGDVNQGFAGLQSKYGELRITDTGIREATIIGQGIGAALRGLRPIAEIQYLDYLLYGLQTLSDDLATLQYRTAGGQKAPLIVRTRGHRLEGVWHSGSPLGMILHSLRGMYVLTPRNMTQAVGFYNTLLQSDDPALMIESLNGYRLKEKTPSNLSSFQLALGEPEILRVGTDATVVTYGSTCRIVEEAANQLQEIGISIEVIDAQTLLPFDTSGLIVRSLKKTSKLVIVDEDVQGGASAFILQQILERDNGYFLLDSGPKTITGKDHRAAYGSDGDYFSKPNVEEVFDGIYSLIAEVEPSKYPSIY